MWMNVPHKTVPLFRSLFRKPRVQQERHAELRFHLEQIARKWPECEAAAAQRPGVCQAGEDHSAIAES
jgi:hypothetical protein